MGVVQCVQKCVIRCSDVCYRVYVLKSVWYGVVKCVLQGLCVEKCVVRCGEIGRASCRERV